MTWRVYILQETLIKRQVWFIPHLVISPEHDSLIHLASISLFENSSIICWLVPIKSSKTRNNQMMNTLMANWWQWEEKQIECWLLVITDRTGSQGNQHDWRGQQIKNEAGPTTLFYLCHAAATSMAKSSCMSRDSVLVCDPASCFSDSICFFISNIDISSSFTRSGSLRRRVICSWSTFTKFDLRYGAIGDWNWRPCEMTRC